MQINGSGKKYLLSVVGFKEFWEYCEMNSLDFNLNQMSWLFRWSILFLVIRQVFTKTNFVFVLLLSVLFARNTLKAKFIKSITKLLFNIKRLNQWSISFPILFDMTLVSYLIDSYILKSIFCAQNYFGTPLFLLIVIPYLT